MLENERGIVADKLFGVGAIKLKGLSDEDGFKLKLHSMQPDAPLSPIFVNLRSIDNPKPGALTRVFYLQIARLLNRSIQMESLRFNFIAPVPYAADPFVNALIMWEPKFQRLKLTKETLSDGTRRLSGAVEDIDEGTRVLVVDDLITMAESKIETIDALRKQGAVITDCLVIVDREQDGSAALADIGVRLHSVFRVTELLSHYVASGLITTEKYAEVLDYTLENCI